MTELSLTRTPVHASYQPLSSREFQSRVYLNWHVTPEPEDAGVDGEIASLLAGSFDGLKVLFLGGPAVTQPFGTWHQESPATFAVRVAGKISRMCITSDFDVVETLFDQPGFDWSQRGQFGLLFPSNTNVMKLPAQAIANAIAKENLSEIPEAKGYLRPGDDGGFAELGFRSDDALARWSDTLKEIAKAQGLQFTPSQLPA